MHRVRLAQETGQALILTLVLLVLLLLTIPAIISFNSHLSRTTVESYQRNLASDAVDAGLSQATWLLAQTTDTWRQAMQDPATTFSYYGLDGNTLFVWSKQTKFTIHASTGLPALPYEIRVTVFAVDPSGQPLRAATALMSPKTMAVSMPNSLSATIALAYFGSNPLAYNNNQLTVDWGPVANFAGSIAIGGAPDNFPRLFSVNSVTPWASVPAASPTTNDSSYWAFASLGECPAVYVSSYQYLATNSVAPDPINPANVSGSGGLIALGSGQTLDGYKMISSTSVLDLQDTLNCFNSAVPTPCGMATMKSVGMDVSAVIVEGDLTLDKAGGAGLLDSGNIKVAVPLGALSEYPLKPTTDPAYNVIATNVCTPGQPDCPLTSIMPGVAHPDLHAFLYVKGSLTVKPGNWVIVGGLRVDGDINFAGGHLYILEDDLIMHNVSVDRMAIQRDNLARVQVGGTTYQVRPIGAAAPSTMSVSDWIIPTKVKTVF